MATPTSDGTLGIKTGSLSVTSMRYHELAVMAWLNIIFQVREGYPVPVVFASPMDAFAHFANLWKDENNPFTYLFSAKDDSGTPLYEPYPSPVRYPLISVYRKNFKYRTGQNFSIHRFRHINWPTVSDNVDKTDLANVTTSRMPMAFDYRYQIDHFCMRPDSQAFFIQKLMDVFWRTGGSLQTWIPVNYPGWGKQLVRLYLDGDIENATPEEPEADKNVEFRTTFTLVVEGYSVDADIKIFPAFWTLVFKNTGVYGRSPTPTELADAEIIAVRDERIQNANPTLDARANVPDDNLSHTLAQLGQPERLTVEVEEPIPTSVVFGNGTLVVT